MEILIWIFIIWAIANSSKKKKRQEQRQQTYQQRPVQQTYQRMVQQNYQQQRANMEHMQATMTAKQQELKSRLQQKYTATNSQARPVQQVHQQAKPVQQAKPAQRQAPKGEIMRRATVNTSEHSVDELELRASEPTLNCVGNIHNSMCVSDMPEESCLMKELNDLMLMGYQADLSFERDFLAEGIDMLNNYEIAGA